jgi:Domain of unknown function (DUF927)
MRAQIELRHIANIEDEATEEAFEEFSFPKIGGQIGTLSIERELADDSKYVRSQLLKRNALLSPNSAESKRQVQAVVAAPPERLILQTASTGWRPDDTAFVTPCEVFDSIKNRPQKLASPRRLNAAQRRGKKPEGNLDVWKADVAGLCGYSDLGITVLSAAFAAPLLKFTGRYSFGLGIFGKARSGKSTILMAAASVGGVGREEALSNWAASDAAIGELCRLNCDMLLPLNETGSLDRRSAYGRIARTIYKISQNQEREVHSKSSFATTDESAEYRTIFVSTSEHSIDELAKYAGETRDEGERARCVCIPANRPGRRKVIDRRPSDLPIEQRGTWAKRTLVKIRKSCKNNHGLAMRPFIKYVMSDLDHSKRQIARYMKSFIEKIEIGNLSSAIEDAADNMSLVYAGGCVAVDAGTLPYTKEVVFQAVATCFRAALQLLEEDDNAITRAKSVLRAKVTSEAVATMCRRDGYADRKGGRRELCIRASTFRAWFDRDGKAHTAALEWLEQKRLLSARRARDQGAKRQADWAEKIVKWPDTDKPTRAIVFKDPFPNGGAG